MAEPRVCGTCAMPEDTQADTSSELRPYGPGGALICYSCAFASPETRKQTEENMRLHMEAALAASPDGFVVLGLDEPIPGKLSDFTEEPDA